MKSAPFQQDPNAPFFVDNEVITLNREGEWIADGYEITHEPTRKLFARSLKKDDEGYFLEIGRETKKIQVEDTAYFVERIAGSAQSGYQICTNDQKQEPLRPESLRYRPGRLTCEINREGTSEEAKFLRAPYIELLRNLQETPSEYFLVIAGTHHTVAEK